MSHVNEIKNIKRNLILLFGGRFISDFGTSLFKFSLSLYVLDVTGSSTMYSLVLTMSILPGILISIFAGTLIDKYDKKRIIFIADVFSAFSSGLLFIFIEIISDNLFYFGLGVIIVSIIQTFLNLGINSGVGNMVPEKMVPKVNSYFQAMGAVLTILGPIIGAVCYGAFGIKMVLLLDAVTYAVGAASTLLMEFVYHTTGEDKSFTFREGMSYIFEYLKKYHTVKILMFMLFVLTFIYYPLTNVALQNIMRLNVRATEIQLSYVVAAAGLGVILGAVTSSMEKVEVSLKRLPKKLVLLSVFILLWCLPLMIYSQIEITGGRNNVVTGIFSAILLAMGFVYTKIVIPTYSYMQMYVDENVRGRVFGLATSALNIAAPIGVVIFGILLEYKVEIEIVVCSAIILLVFTAKMLVGKKNKLIFKNI